MKSLPRALLIPAAGLPLPAGRRGVLIPAGRIGEPDAAGGIVMVDGGCDLAALHRALDAGAAAFALAGCRTGADLQRLATLLAVAEAEQGRAEGATPILAVTDGILPAPASRESLAGRSTRLAALVWDHEALARAIGATRSYGEDDGWTGAFAAARAAVLLTAAAAGVAAYDSMPDLEGDALARSCARARSEGFFGCVVRHQAQAAIAETAYGA